MLIDEFQQEFNRLKSAYGDRVFPDERGRLFYDRFKRLPVLAFKDAVDSIILNLPTPAHVLGLLDGVVKLERAKNRGSDFEEQPIFYKCEACRDFGYGWIKDEVMKCHCAAAKFVTSEEIARHQKHYDLGRKFRLGKALMRKLPYDQKERLDF